VTAGRVVLCTNGFENLTIENEAGSPIDAAFHASVAGVIGYMGGYFDENGQPPLAVSYYRNADSDEPYHYLTRRPYERGGESSVLVCIGGPERFLPDRATYDPSSRFPANIEEDLDLELRRTYRDMPPPATKAFTWHGLMGYTPTGIRRIGFEPLNSVLLYNLGCNGVGILPSIYGGKRIAQLLSGLHLPPSIFDPEMSEMMLRSVSINQKTMRTPML
jgi:glycine/D-amino acid oxidase-like deaminating enzyme